MHGLCPLKHDRLKRAALILLLNGIKKVGYNMHIMRQSACLVVNPITVDAMVSSLLHDGGSGLRLNDCPDVKL